MGINKDKSYDVSNTFMANNYEKNICSKYSDKDCRLMTKMIDEINELGYFIKYLFEISWMDKDDYKLINPILQKYYYLFENHDLKNEIIDLLGKKANYEVVSFLLEGFYKFYEEWDRSDSLAWNYTSRKHFSNSIYTIKDRTRIDDYIMIVQDSSTKKESYFFVKLLGELKVKKAVPILLDLLEENDSNLICASLQALFYFRKEIDLRQYIEPFVDSKDEVIREYASKILK